MLERNEYREGTMLDTLITGVLYFDPKTQAVTQYSIRTDFPKEERAGVHIEVMEQIEGGRYQSRTHLKLNRKTRAKVQATDLLRAHFKAVEMARDGRVINETGLLAQLLSLESE